MAEVETSDIFVHKWGETKFTKAAFYEEVASVVIVGCLGKGLWYPFPSSNK